jgi:hypothetical protein
LDGGLLVINAPSSRLAGAERAFPNRRENERQWFVEVRLPSVDSDKVNAAVQQRTTERVAVATTRADARAANIMARAGRRAMSILEAARARCRGLADATSPKRRARRKAIAARILQAARTRAAKITSAAQKRGAAIQENAARSAGGADKSSRIFALGPLDSASRAEEIAAKWEIDNGEGSTRVHRDLPPSYQRVGVRDRDIDAMFLDEAEDAVEYWFDEPNPNLPSCLLDEIAKLDRSSEDCLLDGIADLMFVSRERIRQVEEIAMRKVRQAGAHLGVETEVDRG